MTAQAGAQGQAEIDPNGQPRIVPMGVVAEVLRLHAQGKSYNQIAAIAGRSHDRVKEIVQREYRKSVVPIREDARKAAYTRLMGALDVAYDMVRTSSGELKLKALDRVVRIEERMAKLFGTDAPVKIDARISEVDGTDLELEEMIRAEQAKARLTRS